MRTNLYNLDFVSKIKKFYGDKCDFEFLTF